MYNLEEYVASSRTGEDGKLKIVSAIDMMQDCSQMWLKSEPVLEEYFGKNNISQLLVSRQLDILRMPAYGERLTISTSIFECQSVYGYRNTIIYDENREPCIVSWSTGAFVCMDTNRLTKVPQEILSKVVFDPKIQMEYLERKIVVPDREMTEFRPLQVMNNDIDMNRHMNNAQYVRIAIEFLPHDFKIDRLRIEYKIPARKGELLYPYMIKQEEARIFILLLDKNDRSHAVMEFSEI